MTYREHLESDLQAFRIQLQPAQIAALAAYCAEVDRWNQKINLTSLSGLSLVRRLVIEPAWIARELSLHGSLLDVGSGNGSPAVPLCIVSDLKSCQMVEARIKRAAFLRHLIAVLELTQASVRRARIEDIAESLSRPDWITLQAVAVDRKLVDVLRRIASPTTTIVWITSRHTEPELHPVRTLTVPLTATRVFLFQLDLS